MRLAKQLALIFIAATAIPMAISWFASGELLQRKEIKSVSERHLLIAKNISLSLQRYHRDLEASFNLVANQMLAGKKNFNLKSLDSSLHFRHFCIANYANGKVLWQLNPQALACPKYIPLKRLTDFKSIAKDAHTVFSPVWSGPKSQPTIYLVRKQGHKLVVGSISTRYFSKLGHSVVFGKQGHAAIVDQTGRVLFHPNPRWVATRKNLSKVSIVQKMLAGQTGVSQFFSPAIKADMIAGYAAVAGAGWAVMVPQPIAELNAAVTSTQLTFFIVLAIGILLAGLATTFAARKFLTPIENVIEGAKEISKGNNDIKVDVEAGWHVSHELQDLQKQFNTMAKAVTEQHREVEEQLAVENAENKQKSEYFANLAHELKTPLNSILGFSSVLRESKPGVLKPHETTEFLGHIEKSATHLLSFVNDLLDLNRLEMGALKLNETEFYLIDPIRFCETTLRRQIAEKKLSLKIDYPNKDLKIFADERSVNQMLINLVSNAVRYSFEKAEIVISVTELNSGDVRLTISDHGIGIPEKDIAEIMKPFKRAQDPQVAEIHGTGLGLSIVKKLSQLHSMDFTIESVHGFSTSVDLVIPACRMRGLKSSKKAA